MDFLAGKEELHFVDLTLADVRRGDPALVAYSGRAGPARGRPLGLSVRVRIATDVLDDGADYHFNDATVYALRPASTAWDAIFLAAWNWAAYPVMDAFHVATFSLSQKRTGALYLVLFVIDSGDLDDGRELSDDQAASMPEWN